jgi:hypothetical protein
MTPGKDQMDRDYTRSDSEKGFRAIGYREKEAGRRFRRTPLFTTEKDHELKERCLQNP